jgi:hypothetical protein
VEVCQGTAIEIQDAIMRCVVCGKPLGKGVCPCDPPEKKKRKRRKETEAEEFCRKLEDAELMEGLNSGDESEDQEDS